MITPDWLSDELNILQAHKELQESILRDITRRIIKTDFTVTDTAAWQAEKLQQSGMLYKDILKEISKETGKSQEEINRAFKDAHTEVFKYDESELEAAGEDAKEFRHMSPQMKAVFTAAIKKASKEIKNLTGTTAVTSQSAFIRACDLAHMKIVSGAFTYQEAIKDAIKTAAKEGVSVVYPSGHVSSLDAAVRRAVLSGVNQTTGTLVKMRAEETGHDLMQLSAHSGAREDHADWQGKIVSLSGRKGYLTLADIGYGEVTGFMGAHCRHTWFIFYEGISKPAYTNEQLEAFKNETVTYEGEVIPLRQALDRQRTMERSIRRSKQELVMFDEAAKNLKNGDKLAMQVEFEKAAVKLKGKEAKLKDFCDKTGLKRDRYREQVFATQTENGIKNFGKSASQKAVQASQRHYDIWRKSIGADDTPKILAKYYDMKYNDKAEYARLKKYILMVDKGEVTTLLGYSQYRQVAIEIENSLLGLKTSTGLEIKGYSAHFVGRVIGNSATNHKFNRPGVSMSEAKEAIEKGKPGKLQTDKNGKVSQLFLGYDCNITVNIHTGELIQTNRK